MNSIASGSPAGSAKPKISLSLTMAILSLALVVNLPGLAVTPILSTLKQVFPNSTQLEEQLLTAMPNLLIIPFVLISGKLSMTRHKSLTIIAALAIFTLASVAYFFAHSMGALIAISCLLGCGAGLLIPFSTGLIAECYAGDERMKMMGLQSGISNLTLVVATFAVGWLSKGNWHLPFVVYLVALIPLVMSFRLGKLVPAQEAAADNTRQQIKPEVEAHLGNTEKPRDGFFVHKIIQLLGAYFFITFATMVVSYYCPYLVESRHWSDSLTGTITSIFFLFIFLPGFLLTKIVKWCRGLTFVISAALMLGGMLLLAFLHQPWSLCIGAGMAGLGYGICQPMFYNKASLTVTDSGKSTMALAIVLAANYLAIVLTPFIVDFFKLIFHADKVSGFAFILSAAMLVIYFIIVWLKRKSFVFNVEDI